MPTAVTPVENAPRIDRGRIPPVTLPGSGDDRSGHRPYEPSRAPLISNPTLGMLMLLAAETMFFVGLIGGFLVLRSGAAVWPPPFQPRLPVLVTGINTLILLASGVFMVMALRAARRGDQKKLVSGLGLAALLGAAFLAVQGYEWMRLIHFGLTISSGSYGSTFYTLIGTHAVHVLAALLWLGGVWVAAGRQRFSAERHTPVLLCAMYWQFVVALWPLLYLLVYLA